jgi:hypothetical protein
MSEILDFIQENYISIVTIVVIILFMLVFICVRGWELNPVKPDSKLVQEVTVETFANKQSLGSNFCESYLGKSDELEKACNQLTESNCSATNCCIFGNGKCLAGDVNGPTYKTDDDGNLITMDSYYYQGSKFLTTK